MKNIMQNRFSCRQFKNEKIENAKIKEILNFARLTPSSCGLEPWKFVVISKSDELDELGKICNNQDQVKACSHAVIILARNDLKSSCEFLQNQVKRKQTIPEKYNKAMKYFANRFDHQTNDELTHYASLQCYLLCANLINIAYSIDIKSCIIGGFDKISLTNFINLTNNFTPVLVVALGMSDETAPAKMRLNLDDILIWR
ncbi:nitroreductase family protein [Campylobacter fetus]|uniref:nitroreductase family protein n=1 Tax=Campylobacter fetus TaxID=196 RepID=UPI0005090F36|nr:nitroreductase family protein [Campylobacter fetus]AIR79635.1 nitroreductase [Campylobacter fetus subsp. fetus 04/554]